MEIYGNRKLFKIECKKAPTTINPSDIPILMDCMGYATIKPDYKGLEKAHEGADKHRKANKLLDQLFKNNPPYTLKEGSGDILLDSYIELCSLKASKAEVWGTDVILQDNFGSHFLTGEADFMSYRKEKLTIVDLKTGDMPSTEKNLYQLYFYAIAVANHIIGIQETTPIVEVILVTKYGNIEQLVSIKELIDFKAQMTRKLRDFSFNYGPHCGKCFKFNKCNIAIQKTSGYIDSLEFKKTDMEKFIEMKPLIDKFYKTLREYIISKHPEEFNIKETEVVYWDKSKLEGIERLLNMKTLPTPAEVELMGYNIKDFVKSYKRYSIKNKKNQ